MRVVCMYTSSLYIFMQSTEESIAETEDFARQVLAHTNEGQEFLQQVDAEVAGGGFDAAGDFSSRPTLLNASHAPLVMPCVTPRFVPTCTAESMRGLGAVSHKYGLPVQVL